MLRAIHIKQFGIFRERTFALGPVTVFSGANQSGKSTLFDAIRIHAFKPDRRGKDNRALYARYGDAIDVRLEWNDDPPEMEDATFMNLFAVGSGQVEVDLAGDWLTGVKKRLFAGGIDPQALIVHFERTASDKGSYAHMRNRSALTSRRDDCEARLAELEEQRRSVLAQMADQETRRGTLKGLQAGLTQKRGREQVLSEELALEERKAERARLKGLELLLNEVAELEKAQQARQPYSVDRTEELDALERAAREADAARIRAEEARQGEQDGLASLREALQRADREVEIRRGWRAGVDAVESRISRYRDLKLSKAIIRGVAAVLAALLGVAAGVLSGWAAWGWGVLAGGLAVAGLVAWLPGWWDQRRLMAELKDRWRAEAGGTATVDPASQVTDSRTLDGVVGALARVLSDVERHEAQQETQARAVREAEARLASRTEELERATREAGARETARAEWLSGLGVGSRDAYVAELGEYRRALKRLNECYQRLEEAQRAHGCSDAGRLRAKIQARQQELAEAGTQGEPMPEAALKEMRESLARLRREIEADEGEVHELDRTSHGQNERLVGRLGVLPEEIAGLREDIRGLQAEIVELDRERTAAGRALELLREVASDETSVLADLSEGVAATFARLSGAGTVIVDARQAAVALAGLRAGEIRAMDRQGTLRAAEHLSSGARHLLYLALRLEMARGERQGAFALLCLDEPFAYLDPDRQMETLEYLRGFLQETGWQLLLFTNEPTQAERARAVFPDCRVHILSGEAEGPEAESELSAEEQSKA